MDETSIYNYKFHTESLASSGQPTKDEIGIIIKAEYNVVINLGLHNSDYSIDNEASIFQENNITYIHIPVIFEAPKKKDLDAFIRTLNKYKGSKIFIHCAANKRASVFIALYRILTLGWEKEKAIKELHTVWLPNDAWQSFINDCS